jgi:hypothetical protein
MATYKEKLKDPRWQKKRLEILERDMWTCQSCMDSASSLHVHHRYYASVENPWDYPSAALVALCETCHAAESEEMPKASRALVDQIKAAGATFSDMWMLGLTLAELFESRLLTEPQWAAIAWAIDKVKRDPQWLEKLEEAYFANLRETRNPAGPAA